MKPIKNCLLLRSSVVLFLCLVGTVFGQQPNCNWMTPNYGEYTTSSADGTYVYTSVTVSGSTNGTCPSGCPCYATHTPQAYNHLGTIGGWSSGPGAPPNNYISWTNNQRLAAAPGSLTDWISQVDVSCTIVGTFFYPPPVTTPVAQYTPVQHNYPRNPLPQVCRVSNFFDAVRNGKAHHANDVIFDDGHGGGTIPPVGTPVTAMEAGNVVEAVSGQGPASLPYPQCSGAPGNYVKIKADGDTYFTIYFHMKPSVSKGQHVSAGQLIGTLDKSGCQKNPHLHLGRKDPSGNAVNITIPCVNPLPTTKFSDGLVDDDVPSNI